MNRIIVTLNNKMDIEKLQTALNLLQTQLSKGSDIQIIRLETIIEKLDRLCKNNLYEVTDLTSQERKEIEIKNLRAHIAKDGNGNCNDVRWKAGNTEDYYYDYTTVEGVSFETFREFTLGHDCYCDQRCDLYPDHYEKDSPCGCKKCTLQQIN